MPKKTLRETVSTASQPSRFHPTPPYGRKYNFSAEKHSFRVIFFINFSVTWVFEPFPQFRSADPKVADLTHLLTDSQNLPFKCLYLFKIEEKEVLQSARFERGERGGGLGVNA